MITLERRTSRFTIYGADTKRALRDHLVRHFKPEERRVIWIGRTTLDDLPHWIANDLITPITAFIVSDDLFKESTYIKKTYSDNSLNKERVEYHDPKDSLLSYVEMEGKRSKWMLICGKKYTRYARRRFMLMRDVY